MKTLIYADLFDFPLTKKELWQRLIWQKENPPKRKLFEKVLKNLVKKKKIAKKQVQGKDYYFLPGRQRIIGLRRRREKEVQRKLKKIQRLVKILSFCPWVWLIGLSGSVAANNARPKDDIDLFIITAPRRLWLTRLWLILVLELLRVRRRPRDKRFANKICLNLFLSADYLDYFSYQPDLFLAYEILQLKPLFQRKKIYQQFLEANQWLTRFLPQGCKTIGSRQSLLSQKNSGLTRLGNCFEQWAYRGQLWWMKRRRTREKALPFLAAFHPKNLRKKILRQFSAKVAKYLGGEVDRS